MCSLIVCSISLYCYVRIKRVYYWIFLNDKIIYLIEKRCAMYFVIIMIYNYAHLDFLLHVTDVTKMIL